MMKINADNLLTADGWKVDQTLLINDDGIIESIVNFRGSEINAADYHTSVLIPGFINLHSHSFQWSMAGLAEKFGCENDSFWSWREMMYRFLKNITPEDLSVISEALYIDMLKAGYTEVGEFHYLHNDSKGKQYEQLEQLSINVIESAKSAGIKICHMPVLYQNSGFGELSLDVFQQKFYLSTDEYFKIFESLSSNYKDNNLVNIGMAPHSLRAISLNELKSIVAYCPTNSPIHIHIAEQQAEVKQSLNFHKKRPVELLFDNVSVDKQWCLIHATHLSDDELLMISESGACVGLCPTTEANLGDGIFPLMKLKKQKGIWGLGSDSHVMIDPREELRLLEYGQRLSSYSRVVYSTQQNPLNATNLVIDSNFGGQRALQSNAGEIKVGKQADLISLDIPDEFSSLTGEQLISKWIFSSRDSWVKDVMVAGTWVIRDGYHRRQESAMNKFKKVLKKLTKDI